MSSRQIEKDTILVNAGLLLEYSKVATDTYRSVGVNQKDIKEEPFYSWLGPAMGMDIEGASELQVARDGRLTTRLFEKKNGVAERPALSIVHLFVEAGANVVVVSHESPDALEAICARAGLPASVQKMALVGKDRRNEVVSSILSSEIATEWLLVYELGLTPRQHQRIVDAVGDRGIAVNVTGLATKTAAIDDQLLKIIEERWTK